MHSEKEIRKAIRPLLDIHGKLSTTEVKQLIETVITYDDEDLMMSETRNEIKIKQRIGNIVSHTTSDFHIYPEGFAVDKRGSKNYFVALKSVNDDFEVITEKEVQERKKKSSQFRPVKIDYEKLNEERADIGLKGELFVVDYEKERVSQFSSNSDKIVAHLSQLQGDGLGYDISSQNDKNGQIRYIEVKTTKNGLDTPFYMSENERKFFKLHESNDNAYIYRVYDFDKESSHGKLMEISAKKLFSDYNFCANSYKVIKK